MCYLKGQLNGESVTYYPGGVKVFERITYLQNVPTGKHVQFYEDGSVLCFREYEKGKVVKEKFYDTKGREVKKEQGKKITNLFPNIPGWKNP
jgi:antitoxin component YwqK of YwqJK toxin-antitoxin module